MRDSTGEGVETGFMAEREQENERRTSANRRNAQRSTGPKTQEGKALVSRNTVKHGFLSRETLLPDEDGSALAHGIIKRER